MNRKERRAAVSRNKSIASGASGIPEAETGRLFQLAVRHQLAGQLAEAEHLCRKILATNSDHVESLHLLGLIAQQVGRNDLAISLIGRAIGLNARIPAFHNNIGKAFCALGRVQDAIHHYMRANSLDPNDSETHVNLADALQQQGSFNDALTYYQQALALKPDHALAHNNYGNALKALARWDEATVQFQLAQALKPNITEFHNNFAVVLQQQGKLAEAQVQYRRALALRPSFTEGHYNLGATLLQQGRMDEAEASFRTAVALKPDFAGAYYNLGIVLAASNRAQEAVANFDKALAIKPDFTDALNNLGNALVDLGHLEKAQNAFERAVKLAPRSVGIYANLARVKRFVADDPQVLAMDELARDIELYTVNDQIRLHFTLGKALSDVKQTKRSFQHLLEGNALKRRQIRYDEADALGIIDRVRRVFTDQLMRGKQGFGVPSCVPVFILGMPRSGTTLVEQILASHPHAFGAGEISDFAKAVASFSGPNGSQPQFPEFVSTMRDIEFRQLGATYILSTKSLAPTAARIVDKAISNFIFAGLIHLALPDARLIHITRDPVDTCVSCFSTQFAADHQPFTYELGELGRYYHAYEGLMAHWRNVLPKEILIEVQYEELVANLEPHARRLLNHCGLEWNDACLNFHQTNRQVRTASATQVRRPLYQSSVGRWRIYEGMLGPLFNALQIDSKTSADPDK